MANPNEDVQILDKKDKAFALVMNEIRKTRSEAIRRFCLVYWLIKSEDKFNPIYLSHLVQRILRNFQYSRARAYDYAHAIRFCEMTVNFRKAEEYPSPWREEVQKFLLGKVGSLTFMLPEEHVRALSQVLREKRCTFSEFLVEAIERETSEDVSQF